MRTGIHPEYKKTLITCACGRVSETRSTVDELHVEICSHCHPFFTGRQKLVDTAGRVERFRAKYGNGGERAAAEAESSGGAETAVEAPEVSPEAPEAESDGEGGVAQAEEPVDRPEEAEATADAQAADEPDEAAAPKS